jgi:Domain of unknown function (DUF4389)
MTRHPVRLEVRDDRERSRLTVGFRVLLAIPHLFWLSVWAFGAFLLAPIAWVATLVKGEMPDGLHDFYAMFVRYATHVNAYLCLGANPFPGFLGERGGYPVTVEIPAPERQNRWTVGFRLILALPPLMLAGALGAGAGGLSSGGVTLTWSVGVLAVVPFLAWFACLAKARMPRGFRDVVVYGIGYAAQVYSYVLLLTPRYPDSNPAQAAPPPLPEHPIGLTVTDDDLQRSRLTVFFRLLLALPHFIWATLWGLAVFIAAPFAWLIALVTGRLPGALERFFGAYVRYSTHVYAFTYLAANPFPGFTGAPGRFPVDLGIAAAPERQSRWAIAFRWLLAFPAFLVSSALGSAMAAAAVGAWFASLFTGRMPEGLRNLVAYALRYNGQTYGYAFLLTDRYPYSGPGPCGDVGAPEAAIPVAEAA